MTKQKLTNIHEAIMKPKSKEVTNIYFPSGCDLFDIQAGGGEAFGHKAGEFINIVGGNSSGKTLLACEIIAATYHNQNFKGKLKWVYDDCESGFTFNTKKLYGFDIVPKEGKIRSHTVEQAYCNIREFIEDNVKVGEYGIYILDSLDALASKEENERANNRYKAHKSKKEYDEPTYGTEKAKYLSKEFFRQLAGLVEDKKILIIIISQTRMNFGFMAQFEKYVRAGGTAMDFYAQNVFWVYNVNHIIKNGLAIGITIKVKNTKGKNPRPYRTTFIKMYFDYGIDNIASNIDYLFDLLTPKGELKVKKNDKIQWSNKELNLEGIKSFLQEYNIEDEYRKLVHPKLKVSEVIEWLENNPNDKIRKLYLAEFSPKMSRKEMIDFVVKYKLEKLLKEKVIKKWEAIEDSVKSNLPPKYSDD